MSVDQMKVTIVTRQPEGQGSVERVSGFIGNNEVIALAPVMGAWGVATSTCMPGSLEQSREQAKCMAAVFEKFDALRREGRIVEKPETISMMPACQR